jgi:hypothetical protein
VADGFSVRTEGLEAVDACLASLLPRTLQLGALALEEELHDVLGESEPLVPFLTGALAASGAVSDPIEVGDAVAATIGYGGDNGEISYALVQHEDLALHHDEGREAKFLETPLLAWTKEGPGRIARAIYEGLGRP